MWGFTKERRARNLGFAAGPHMCIAAPLARMEAEVALRHWLDATSDFELAEQGPLGVGACAEEPHGTSNRGGSCYRLARTSADRGTSTGGGGMASSGGPGAFSGVRVLEVGDGKALAYGAKLLRDLGAEVIKVEPPDGDALRRYGPFPADRPDRERSGLFIYLNGGKRGACLDLEAEAGQSSLRGLLADADVLLHSLPPAEADRLNLAPSRLAREHPGLVVAAVTPFGSDGPYANWKGYALQAQAGSGVAFRTGAPEREPLNGPLDGAELHHGAVHLAAAVVLALFDREQTGRGQFVDISITEAALLAVCGVGIPRVVYRGQELPRRHGRLVNGRGPWGLLPAADGEYSIIALFDHQWRALANVIGRPDWPLRPDMESAGALTLLAPEERDSLREQIADWTRGRTRAEIWERMRAARVPSQPVHTIPEVVDAAQLAERGYFLPAPGPHPPLTVPGAPYRLSLTPWRAPGPPPRLTAAPATGWRTGRHASSRQPRPHRGSSRSDGADRRDEPGGDGPLSGIRVLDLTQAWAGPLLVRFLADFGADVILVETPRRPRWMAGDPDPRQPFAWEWIYRNRRSVTLDLKGARGRELCQELARRSDVVVDNFAAGVMEGLGLGYEQLAAANPRLVVASLSGSGETGPWSDLTTFGPSLSALYGIKSLYGYPEDGMQTEDPSEMDPIAAGYGALAVLAALYHRDRTGRGQRIEMAQGEAGLAGLAEAVIEHVWNGRTIGRVGNTHRVLAPHGVYPCAGEDRWIAIACGSDDEWEALAGAAGRLRWLERPAFRTAAGRRGARSELDAEIAGWTREHEAPELERRLQDAGVAAVRVMDTFDIVADPHHAYRREHFVLPPAFPADTLLDGNPWRLSWARPRLRRPAPAPGAHNDEVFSELLGLSATEIRELEAAGVS